MAREYEMPTKPHHLAVWRSVLKAEGGYAPPVRRNGAGGDGHHTLFGITDLVLAENAATLWPRAHLPRTAAIAALKAAGKPVDAASIIKMQQQHAGVEIARLGQYVERDGRIKTNTPADVRAEIEKFRETTAPTIWFSQYVKPYGLQQIEDPVIFHAAADMAFNAGGTAALYALRRAAYAVSGDTLEPEITNPSIDKKSPFRNPTGEDIDMVMQDVGQAYRENPQRFREAFTAAWKQHYQELATTWPNRNGQFLQGWQNRVDKVMAAAGHVPTGSTRPTTIEPIPAHPKPTDIFSDPTARADLESLFEATRFATAHIDPMTQPFMPNRHWTYERVRNGLERLGYGVKDSFDGDGPFIEIRSTPEAPWKRVTNADVATLRDAVSAGRVVLDPTDRAATEVATGRDAARAAPTR